LYGSFRDLDIRRHLFFLFLSVFPLHGRRNDQKWQFGMMQNTFHHTTHEPAQHSTTAMSGHRDQVKGFSRLFCLFDKRGCYIRTNRNRCRYD